VFICFFCKRWSLLGEKLTLVATKTRTKVYSEGRTGIEVVEERPKCPGCLGTRVVSFAASLAEVPYVEPAAPPEKAA
jgi:hypothetical protein